MDDATTRQRAKIATLVKNFAAMDDRQEALAQDCGVALLYELISEMIDQDDIYAKATIRYLMHRRMWQSEPEWRVVLDKFFGPRTDRPVADSAAYRGETNALISMWFDYQMPEDPPPAEPKPRKKAVKKKKTEEKSEED